MLMDVSVLLVHLCSDKCNLFKGYVCDLLSCLQSSILLVNLDYHFLSMFSDRIYFCSSTSADVVS